MVIKKKWLMFLLILPGLLLYTVPFILPAAVNFPMALFSWNGITPGTFTGLRNFRLLFTDPVFYLSLRNTFILMAFALCVELPLGFGTAVLMRRNFKGNDILRAIFFIPCVVAPMLQTLIWNFVFNPSYGFINTILDRIGLGFLAQNWLGTPWLSILSICMVGLWGGIGFHTTILLAGIRSISPDLYEAAEIDGASPFRRATSITLPLIKQQISVSVVLIIIGAISQYERVKFLTNGGPQHSSEVLSTFIYNQGFQSMYYGYGMAGGVVAFLLCLILAFAYIRLSTVRD